MKSDVLKIKGHIVLSPDEWKQLIADCRRKVGQPSIKATTAIRMWSSFSSPALVLADDSKAYVIKGAQVGRPLFTDQVVARVGLKIGAPVGQPEVVIVEHALIQAGGALAHFGDGPAHATLAISQVSADREGIAHTTLADNRQRFAALALLYGLFGAADHQFLYGIPPALELVHSVDHGHFLGGPGWTTDSLSQLPDAEPDSIVLQQCAINEDELDHARENLALISDQEIALAVSFPPDEWNVTFDERAVVAAWISIRRDQLING